MFQRRELRFAGRVGEKAEEMDSIFSYLGIAKRHHRWREGTACENSHVQCRLVLDGRYRTSSFGMGRYSAAADGPVHATRLDALRDTLVEAGHGHTRLHGSAGWTKSTRGGLRRRAAGEG
jgi:hypothetical protein